MPRGLFRKPGVPAEGPKTPGPTLPGFAIFDWDVQYWTPHSILKESLDDERPFSGGVKSPPDQPARYPHRPDARERCSQVATAAIVD